MDEKFIYFLAFSFYIFSFLLIIILFFIFLVYLFFEIRLLPDFYFIESIKKSFIKKKPNWKIFLEKILKKNKEDEDIEKRLKKIRKKEKDSYWHDIKKCFS